jgi:transcriptional regulator with XRE-family HTH domain
LNQQEDIGITLHKVSQTLGWEKKQLIERLGVTQKEYDRLSRDFNKIPVYKLYKLSKGLDIDPGRFMKGEIDYEVLYQHQNGNLPELKQKYKESPTSRIRTVQNAIDYLDVFSREHVFKILRKLQINFASLKHPESLVNVRLIDDIYIEMMKLGYKADFFKSLAKEGAINYKNSLPFYGRFKGISSPKELYENFFDDHIRYIDRNWDYKILSSSDKEMVFEVKTSESLQEITKKKAFGSWGFTMHRVGFAQGLFSYIGMEGLNVKLLKTIHEGEKSCTYKIEYPEYTYH